MFIGRPVPRKEGRAKVTGAARYVDDLTLPGHAARRHRAQPGRRAAESATSDSSGDVPWDEFTVVTAADVPPPNRIALILDDQPCLADGVVNHPEEPVVLLAHPDKSLVEKARRSVDDRHRAAAGGASRSTTRSRRGPSSGATTTSSSRFSCSAATSTPRSRTAAHGRRRRVRNRRAGAALHRAAGHDRASRARTDGVTVWGSLQCPYYVHKALVDAVRAAGRTRCASSRWRPAADSAARKSTRR